MAQIVNFVSQGILKGKIWGERDMDAEQTFRPLEWLDNLVYQKKGRQLSEQEKAFLAQVLTGKKLTAIKINGYENAYIRNGFAKEVWNLLSLVTGKKNIGKINALKVLNDLYLEQMQLKAVSYTQVNTNTQNELNVHVIDNRLKSASGRKGYCVAADSGASSKNYNQTNSCSTCSGKLPINKRLRQLFKVSRSSSQKTSDSSRETATPPFYGSSRTTKFDNLKQTNSKTYSWYTYMKFLKSGLPFLLGFALCGCWFGLSWLANNYGADQYQAGKLQRAELGYRIVAKLSPWSSSSHYNLGTVYEDQQNYQQAQAEYQRAMELGEVGAYNNQARLYLLSGKYDSAVSLLQVGSQMAKNDNELVRYSFKKNLGWARLLQGRLEEAEAELDEAIAIRGDSAAAYCLLAQVKEGRGEQNLALLQWENCLRYTHLPRTPEEDKWMNLAQQRLKTGENNK